MTVKDRIIEIIKKEMEEIQVSEEQGFNSFKLTDKKIILFPGAVYSFFAILTEEEASSLYDEAKEKNTLNINDCKNFKPLFDNVYPLYWGKDKYIGKRLYEHLTNPKGNGVIRLSKYNTLKDKQLYCYFVVVNDFSKLESHLQQKFPHILSTKMDPF